MASRNKRATQAIRPCSVLASEYAKLARALRISYRRVLGRRAMGANTALHLRLDVSADFWMKVQKCRALDFGAEPVGAEIERALDRRRLMSQTGGNYVLEGA